MNKRTTVEIDTDDLNALKGTISELKTALNNIIWEIDTTTADEADEHHALGWVRYVAKTALEAVAIESAAS